MLTKTYIFRRVWFLCLVLSVHSLTVARGEFFIQRLTDGAINPEPAEFTAVGENVFFASTNHAESRPLWRTDGTPAGTTLVRNDLWVHDFAAVGGALLFLNDDSVGETVWRSDGSAAGTVMLGVPSPADRGNSREVLAVGDLYYWASDDGTHGLELWRSDGTSPGTFMVKDINPSGSSDPSCFMALNNILYFAADNGTGRKMWRTDGTQAGTYLVSSIEPVKKGNHPFAVLNNVLYFAVPGDPSIREVALWRSDGTLAGTYKVVRVTWDLGAAGPAEFRTVGNLLYFVATQSPFNPQGQLFRSDGSAQGTYVLNGNVVEAVPPVSLGSYSYFGGQEVTGETYGQGILCRTDGTVGGTAIIQRTGAYSPVGQVGVLGATIFFSSEGPAIWKTDGSPESAVQFLSGLSGILKFTACNDKLFFWANDGIHGETPWVIWEHTLRIFLVTAPRWVEIGSPLSLEVRISGAVDPVFYQWARNGTDIPDATQSTYRVDSTGQGDGGSYVCRVTDAVGSDESPPMVVDIVEVGSLPIDGLVGTILLVGVLAAVIGRRAKRL